MEENENKKRAGLKISIQFAVLILLLVGAFCLAVCFGAEKVSLAALFGGGDKFEQIILKQLRLPRALLVLLTGILLGGSGAVFQMFFRNPLAEPGIMGISSGATLGAVVASVISSAGVATGTTGLATGTAGVATGTTGLAAGTSAAAIFRFISPVNLAAFGGALAAGLLVTALAFSRAGKNSSIMLLLCGTALGTLYSSVSSVVLLTCDKELHSIYTWILGSFNGRGWNELLFILLPAAVSVAIMVCICGPLDLLSGGERSAASLGVEVDRLRVLVLISGALAVSAGVCAGGTISFVGLIAPHICRKIVGPRGRVLVPASMIFGGVLLLFADTLAKVCIAPGELPAGVITAILGVPFFLSLCLKK